MKRKVRSHKTKKMSPLRSGVQIPSDSKRKAMLQALVSIEKMEIEEKIELFQQLEVAQGLRKNEKSILTLSAGTRIIMQEYESLPNASEKNNYAEGVKNHVFRSLKKSIAE